MIEVADEGPGMATEDAARVFERFWRADPSRDRASGGAGLGLAIVAAIADAHGGRAEVQTAPGEGATFRVYLPRTAPTPRRRRRRPDRHARDPDRELDAPSLTSAESDAHDELAEVVAREQADERFGRAVEPVEHVLARA